MRTVGTFSIVLHAHLPYVHHPEYPEFLEEDWLFEAITETYVPLLLMMERLQRDRVRFRLTMSLTPPLCEMLANPLLQSRYLAHLDKLLELAQRQEVERRKTPFASAARHAARKLSAVRATVVQRKGDLLGAFAELERQGGLAIITCAATHGLLPLMATDEARWAQVALGVDTHKRHFGRAPRGMWLPECAFVPGLDAVVAEAGIEYFFLESHGLLGSRPPAPFGTASPVRTPSGVAAFGRDPNSSRQVWSSIEGYPGDGLYREFYRDLGYDLPYEDVRPYLHGDGVRRNVGLKFHRITGRVDLGRKEPYVPEWAERRASEHAAQFAAEKQREAHRAAAALGIRPHFVAPFDAELFGHWWYEGPTFLEMFFRHMAADVPDVALVTCEEQLALDPHLPAAQPAMSSWGDKGYFEVWLNSKNDWIYPHLHLAEERMVELATRWPEPPTPLYARALAQCARELVLAQSSDWAFIMSMGTAVPYAHKRTREHITRFTELYEALLAGSVSEPRLRELEFLDNAFAHVDYRCYHPSQVRHPGAGSAVVWSP
jgi:1,4-alpha-glucan branching enzyme